LKFALAQPLGLPFYPAAHVMTLLTALVLAGLGGCSAQTAEDHFVSAQAYVAAGQEDAAIIELKNALKKSSSYVDARAQLADLLFASGDYRAAEADYRRALESIEALADSEASAVDSALKSRLIRAQQLCKIRLRRAAEVISELDLLAASSGQAAETPALQPEDQALLGHARLALDDVELARQEFDQALERDEQLSLAYFGRALVAWRSDDFQLATSSFNLAVESGTHDPQLLLSKAEFELGQGDFAAAKESFERAETLPGNDLPARLGLARVQILQEDYVGATGALDALLGVSPDLPPAIYLQALVAYKQGELDRSQLFLRKVLSDQSNYSQALYLLGAVQFQQQEFLQAEANLSTYIAQEPDSESGRKLLGAVRMQTGNYDGVVAALSPLGLESGDAQSLAILGSAYARLGRLNEASEYLDKAVSLAPDVGELRNQLAVTLLATGDSAEAIGQLESAIKLDSELQLSDYLLVLAQLRNGNVEQALLAAKALRERAPEDPMGENLLGAVRFAQGDVAAARAAFNSALTKDPTFQPAALNLVRLELAEDQTEAAFGVLQALLVADPDNERALLKLAELELNTNAQAVPVELTAAIARAKGFLQQGVQAHENSLPLRLALARLGLLEGDAAIALAESAKALQLAPDNAGVLAVRIDSLLLAGKMRDVAGPLRLLEQRVKRPGVANHAQLLGLAQLFEKAGQPGKARDLYRQLEDDPSAARDQVPGKVLDEARLALSRFDLRDGDAARAQARLNQVSDSAHSSAKYRLLTADIKRVEGNVDAARRIYEALIDESNRQALFRLVALHRASDAPQRADELLQQWSELHPDDTDAEMVLGTGMLSRGDFAAARSQFEAILDRAPNNVVVLNNLAWLYQQTGDTRAREVAKRAWSLAPTNADVADTYGWILVGAGEPELGSDVLVKAHGLAPRNISIAYHAASALAEIGRTQQARAILNGLKLEEDSLQPSGASASSADKSAALALLRQLVAVDEIEAEAEEVNELIE